jgi:hypothetical protein
MKKLVIKLFFVMFCLGFMNQSFAVCANYVYQTAINHGDVAAKRACKLGLRENVAEINNSKLCQEGVTTYTYTKANVQELADAYTIGCQKYKNAYECVNPGCQPIGECIGKINFLANHACTFLAVNKICGSSNTSCRVISQYPEL